VYTKDSRSDSGLTHQPSLIFTPDRQLFEKIFKNKLLVAAIPILPDMNIILKS
jgi:hypothetical protein